MLHRNPACLSLTQHVLWLTMFEMNRVSLTRSSPFLPVSLRAPITRSYVSKACAPGAEESAEKSGQR